MIDTALSGISHLALRSSVRDDDGIDQLHHFVTVTMLAFFAAIAGFKEYASEPINCWNYGNYLLQHYQQHVNSFCWTHSLYQYPNQSNLNITPYELNSLGGAKPDSVVREEDFDKITFYRWVTVVFLLQAFLFKFPNLVWREFNSYSGSNIVKMVEMLQGVLFAKTEEKAEKLQQVALFLEQWLRIHRKPRWFLKHGASLPYMKKTISCCMMCIGTDTSNYLSTLYLVVKALFLFNNLMQFFILSGFLHINFWNYGVQALGSYSTGSSDVFSNTIFPIVALCHFQTYDNYQAKGIWVQCILTINMFLEKLFLIEWLWLLIMLVVTIISFSAWCYKILQTQAALKFVESYLRLMQFYSEPVHVPKTCTVEQFVTEYLRSDGIFVLRILAVNTDEVVVSQLVEELWKRYIKFKLAENGHLQEASQQAETTFSHDSKEAADKTTEAGAGVGVISE
ncbi:innexin unc-9-like isoform X3 [Pomacea canaliculata]|nr:innexin unc-9-like isoform X3 [Pomacea canaliculata]XP_025089061.1 innexin unc-9-like isoform X3 [Pomacea canaliculata]